MKVRFCGLLISALLGFFTAYPIHGAAGAVGHMTRTQTDYCNVNEYRETYQVVAYGGNNAVTWQNQLHYRVNGDCSWKAYNEIYTAVGGGCSQSPCFSVYNNGSNLHDGCGGTCYIFDGTKNFYCTKTSATGNYQAISVTPALIADENRYWSNSSNCSTGYEGIYYYPSHQP